MAKASKEEWQALIDFFQNLEEMVESDPWNSEIGEYVVDKMRGDVGAGYNRILWGFDTLVENVCDPDLTYLEWKPELIDLKAQRDEARAVARRLHKRNRFLEATSDAFKNTLDRLIPTTWRIVKERDEARELYKALAKDIFEAYYQTCPKEWAYSDPHQALGNIVDVLKNQRDEARAVARRLLRKRDSSIRYSKRVEEISFIWEDRAKAAETERDEAMRLLQIALDENPAWSSNSALAAEEMLEGRYIDARRRP